jgi:ATP synthase F1 delta subunit
MISKQLYARGLQHLLQKAGPAAQHGVVLPQQVVSQFPVRDFAKRGRKKKDDGSSATASENEHEEEVERQAAPTPVVPSTGEFSVGDVKVINSTPDHKSPSSEDTIEGRYAAVLFTAASQQEALYKVFVDMKFIAEMYKHSETFQIFSMNQAIGKKECEVFIATLKESREFNDTTLRLIEVLFDNRRFKFIKKIADHYAKLYQTFNKEEKITIISAHALSSGEQQEVVSALKQNP